MIALALPLLLVLAAPLDVAGYRARLEQIDAALAQGRAGVAAQQARALLAQDSVRAGDASFAPDAWVLGPIARGEPRRPRLRALLAALAAGPPDEKQAQASSPPGNQAADRASLAELRRAQDEETALAAGGELRPLPLSEPPLAEQLLQALEDGAAWIGKRLAEAVRWLIGLFPDDASPQLAGSPANISRLVFVVVGLIVAAVVALAVRSALAPRPVRLPAQPAPAVEEDADPTARTASGWEERARALAAEGRAREAIRAWYHALLVDCYGSGVLHYRPGTTNWEYAHALSPALRWRPRFEELTRRFDLEWYGSAQSSAGALEEFATDAAIVLGELRRRA